MAFETLDGRNEDRLAVATTAPAKNEGGSATEGVFPPSSPPALKNERERLAVLRHFEVLDTPPEQAFDQIVRLAAKLFKVPMALVSLVDEHRQWFKARVGLNVLETSREASFCAHAIAQDGVFVVEDATVDPRFAHNPLVTGNPNIRFYAGAPLKTSDGLALGSVCVLDDRPRAALTEDEKETLKDLSALVMAEIEACQTVGYLAPVTRLPNRMRFLADLDAFIVDPARGFQHIAAVVVGVARPQEYSDLVELLGNSYADAFEQAAADRLRACLPVHIKLYQISEFRFGCVVPSDDDIAIERIAETMAMAFQQPVMCQEIPILTTARAGISEYPKDVGTSLDLLRTACSALRHVVNRKRPWLWYDAEFDQRSRRSFKILTDIPAALSAADQFSVIYQPKLDLSTGRCRGAESLVRWTHPQLGPISPGEFIPLTERTALMRPLTDWVLAATFRQVAAWHAAGLELPVSINISMLDLEYEDFPEAFENLMRRHGMQRHWIDVEVTESALISNRELASRQLAALRSLGIEIEIDDFGTGQSALSYLKYIPASVVKIDQSFVRNLATDDKDQKMVASTIELAHALGFKVTAEGVETSEVYDWLADHGCDCGQGYFMSRPLLAEQFECWVRDNWAQCGETSSKRETTGKFLG